MEPMMADGDSSDVIDPETPMSEMSGSLDASTESSSFGSLLNVLRARRAAQGPIGFNAPSKTVYMPGSGPKMPQVSSTSPSPQAGFGYFGLNGTNSSTTTDASATALSQGWGNPLQNLVAGQSTTSSTTAPQGLVGRRRRSAEEESTSIRPSQHGSGAQILGGILNSKNPIRSGAQMLGGILSGNGTSPSESPDMPSSSGTESPTMVLPQRLIRKRAATGGRPSFLGTPSIMPVEPLNEAPNKTASDQVSSSTIPTMPIKM